MDKTCFVIMPIGEQIFGDIEVSAVDLRNKYDDLIKVAISNARSDLEIIRSDDITSSGTITSDILTLLMHSDYVVADVTYPNPNVFYELGIRHTCRPGTILIKENGSANVPFDISHLRYINYENTSTGLKKLSKDLKNSFDDFDRRPNYPDNHVLELASRSKYKFLKFDNEEEEQKRKNAMRKALLKIIETPKLLAVLLKKSDPMQAQLLKELSKSPETAEVLLEYFVESGSVKL